MTAPQRIRTEAGEELVVLSLRAYEALLARTGDEAAEDAMTARLVDDAAGEPFLPLEAWDRMNAGEAPLKVLRELRGLSQKKLAAAAGLGQAHLSMLEAGTKGTSVDGWRRLAAALDVTVDVLVGEPKG